MGMPSAPHLNVASQIRKAVNIPIIHAGGIADIATARHAIKGDHVDLVGMARAQIADPFLVQKLAQGEEERIRPCVGLGYCVDRVNQGKQAVCGHNAATGREAMLPHVLNKTDKKKKVVVVGGGPGGLEASRVCAERGHEVVLFEASDRLGGQINLACKGTTRKQIWGIADWLIQEVYRLGADVRLNSYAESSDILAEEPDAVIIASGGWPESYKISGHDLLTSSWNVLSGETRVSGDVLLFDEVGDQAAAVCADVMVKAGCKVTLVTPDRMVAHDLGPTNSSVVLRDLARQHVQFDCLLDLVSVEMEGNRKNVSFKHVLTGDITNTTVDYVVIENGVKPMDSLYFELKQNSRNLGQLDHQALIEGSDPFIEHNSSGQFDLARLGDAVASRNIHAAIFDALRVCKNL